MFINSKVVVMLLTLALVSSVSLADAAVSTTVPDAAATAASALVPDYLKAAILAVRATVVNTQAADDALRNFNELLAKALKEATTQEEKDAITVVALEAIPQDPTAAGGLDTTPALLPPTPPVPVSLS